MNNHGSIALLFYGLTISHLAIEELLPSDAADIVAAGLSEVAHIAIAEDHAVGGEAAVLGRRPIVEGLSVGIPARGTRVATTGIYAKLIKDAI